MSVFSNLFIVLLCVSSGELTGQEDTKPDIVIGPSYLKYQSLVYRSLYNLKATEVSNACYQDSKRTIEGINRKETWAMKVLDGSGDQEPGFMLGNSHWLGSKTTCDSINTPYKLTLSDRYKRNTVRDLLAANASIAFQYRMVYARHASPWQVDLKFFAEHILHIGLCLPASCSNAEVQILAQHLLGNATKEYRVDDLDLRAQVLRVKDMALTTDIFFKWTVVVFAISLALALLLATTAYLIDDGQESDELKKPSVVRKAFLHFSPSRNLAYIYDTKQSSKAIPVINGIKTISCFTIVAFHTVWYSFFAAQNKAHLVYLSESLSNQWVINGTLVVDVFFAISGFLMCHNFLRNTKLHEEIKVRSAWGKVSLFGRKVLQRYFRLLPLNIAVGLATATNASVLDKTSLFFLQERADLNCERFWWRDLLYIQNVFTFEESCMSWTWYLACELQYFILFLAILFIYARNERVAKTIFGVLALTCCCYTFVITLKHEYVPSVDVMFWTRNDVYTEPVQRVGPYFVGVAGGWIYAQQKGNSGEMSKKLLSCISVLASLLVVVYLHGAARNIDYRLATTYLVLGRWIFAALIVAFILTNLFGYQNRVTRFLSAKFFVHMAKLEYSIYLLNPLVVAILCGFARTSQSLDYAAVYTLWFGVSLVSYVLAVVFATLFELPISKLVNSMFENNEKKS